jgi:hypothetical protein
VGGTDLALNAWHGTPHEIKGNFDISKVGTGEGAQSYGHGMYFGEARGTGEEYRKILSSKVDVNGKPLYRNNNIVGSTGNKELDDYLIANIGDVKATKKQLLSDIKEIRTGNPVAAKEMQQTLLDLRNANVNSVSGGNLYKVDIPDAAIPMMLNWDQPLAKQMPEVLNLLKNNPAVLEDLAKGKTLEQLTGADAYKAIASSFDVGQKEAYKLASEYLASQGIPGIKYYDQVSRKSNVTSSPRTQLDAKIEILQKDVASGLGNQEYLKRRLANLTYERDRLPTATSNFVMFDPSTVKILEKNDVPVSRKQLLQQEFDKLDK